MVGILSAADCQGEYPVVVERSTRRTGGTQGNSPASAVLAYDRATQPGLRRLDRIQCSHRSNSVTSSRVFVQDDNFSPHLRFFLPLLISYHGKYLILWEPNYHSEESLVLTLERYPEVSA